MQTAIELAEALLLAIREANRAHEIQKDEMRDRVNDLEEENAELRKQNGHLSGELIKSQDRVSARDGYALILKEKISELENLNQKLTDDCNALAAELASFEPEGADDMPF
jgi:predicted nuclease with TOPRIM domain